MCSYCIWLATSFKQSIVCVQGRHMETFPYFTGMDGLNACLPWHVLVCLVLPTSQVQLLRLRINWNMSSGSKFKPKQCKTLWTNLIMKFLTSDMHNAWGDACQVLQVVSMHAKLTPGWALNCHWVIFDPIQKIWTKVGGGHSFTREGIKPGTERNQK